MLEGSTIALDSIRANKVRAALTILGVAIGVTVVIAMASAITGINRSITGILESAGPKTFFVYRYFSGGLEVSDGSDEMSPWRRMPPLTVQDAELIRQLPAVRDVNISEYTSGPVSFEGVELKSVDMAGMSPSWNLVNGGEILAGRNFTPMEYAAGARVVVINDKLAESLFPGRDPVGKRIKISGQPFQVVGMHVEAASLFSNANEPRLAIPHTTFTKSTAYWKDWLDIAVLPTETATVQEAQDQVTTALRSSRGLRPGPGRQLRHRGPGPDPRQLQQDHRRVLRGDDRPVERGAHGGRRRRGGDHDDLGHRAHPRDRGAQGARRHPAGDHVPVPGRGRDADAGGVPGGHGRRCADRLGHPVLHPHSRHRARCSRWWRPWSRRF